MRILEPTSRAACKNILFATDLSPASESALSLALNIARHFESKLYAVHLIPPEIYTPVPPSEWPKIAREEEQSRNEGKRYLEDTLSSVRHEVVFERGEVWPTLSRLIRENEIDLLIVGTRGQSGVVRAVLGSVAEEVFCQAPCPVLTVGPGTSETEYEAALKYILYATDFSFESLAAVPCAITFARAFGAQLILLHVIDEPQINQISAALQTLRDLVPFGAALTPKPKCRVEHGKPADTILKFSTAENAGLIVLGVRSAEGRVITTTHSIRSTAYKIAAQAACPVLTVRG